LVISNSEKNAIAYSLDF